MGERWNPEEPNQFFWIDDAFGVKQFEPPLVLEWNRLFPKIKAMINARARVVLTSRDYIYKRAKQDLKESAFPLMYESQVVINMQDLSINERRQMLYNHIKLGGQPREFRSAIRPYLEKVASHPRFIPEMARRLGDPLFTRNLNISELSILDFVERQEQLLQEVIQGLDKHSRAALALIFIRNSGLESPIELGVSETSALSRLGTDLGETITALAALKDSLTVQVREEGRTIWRFKHPTIGDAYASILLKNAELMGIYIEGANVEQLDTITCGDVNFEGAVVVPSKLYSHVETKLAAFAESGISQGRQRRSERERDVDRFLAFRCDRAFLDFYLSRHQETLERVSSPGLPLFLSSKLEVAISLFELGLFPEKYRRKFVERVAQYAVDGEDG